MCSCPAWASSGWVASCYRPHPFRRSSWSGPHHRHLLAPSESPSTRITTTGERAGVSCCLDCRARAHHSPDAVAAGKHPLPGVLPLATHQTTIAAGHACAAAALLIRRQPCYTKMAALYRMLSASLAVCPDCLPHPLCLCCRGRAKVASIAELRRPDRGFLWKDTVTLRVGVRTATPPPPQRRQQQASPLLAPPLLPAPPTGQPQQLGAAA